MRIHISLNKLTRCMAKSNTLSPCFQICDSIHSFTVPSMHNALSIFEFTLIKIIGAVHSSSIENQLSKEFV